MALGKHAEEIREKVEERMEMIENRRNTLNTDNTPVILSCRNGKR